MFVFIFFVLEMLFIADATAGYCAICHTILEFYYEVNIQVGLNVKVYCIFKATFSDLSYENI